MITIHGKLKRLFSKDGFTLVEVMVAVGLLAVEMLAVIAIFTTSIKSNSYARKLAAASSIAQTSIEEAKNTDYDNLEAEFGTDQCYDRNLNEVSCGGSEIYTRQMTVTQDTPISGMSEVRVIVSWMDDSGNSHKTDLVSSISKY